MSDNERFYDDEVAPVLMDLAAKCRERGMSLVAAVEYEPGAIGQTVALDESSGFAIRLVDAATRAVGNVDSLYISLARYGAQHGHSSMVLAMMERGGGEA